MKRASQHFTEDQRKQIAQAIAKAETTTSAEIVPVVATASGRYDRGEDLAGVMIAIIALVLAWIFFQHEDPTPGSWGGLPITLGLPWLVGIVVIGFFVGMGLAMKFAWLSRLFTPRLEMITEVEGRARQVFFDQRIHHTQGASGVLIFISLFERRVVVLADREVMSQLKASDLERHCDELIRGVKSQALPQALIAGIERIGAQLAEHLPASDEANPDELSDALITID